MEPSQYFATFLVKNKDYLSKTLDLSKVKARILSTQEQDLQTAGALLGQGRLVAFPTETVYGLGADALNEEAVYSIFKTKNRPLTDPVIVHVNDANQALSLVDINQNIERLFRYLSNTFWPGPLTVIMKAKSIIPSCVTADTGFVGIRCPNNEIAQKLIKYSKKPIAAPSANIFAHVSPTSSIHVFNDLFDKEISIIDGENSKFGIESTVIKLIELDGAADSDKSLRILVLRNGSVSDKALIDHLALSEVYKAVDVVRIKKMKVQEVTESSEAPGQLLKHYSPNCDTFLLEKIQRNCENDLIFEKSEIGLKESVLIDFGESFGFLRKEVLDYCSLSESGNLVEAMNRLYDSLRWAENVNGVKQILIANLEGYFEGKGGMPEFLDTVFDKTYRSSSGKRVGVDGEKRELFMLKQKE